MRCVSVVYWALWFAVGANSCDICCSVGWPRSWIEWITATGSEVRNDWVSRNVSDVFVRTIDSYASSFTGDRATCWKERNNVGAIKDSVAIDITAHDNALAVGNCCFGESD